MEWYALLTKSCMEHVVMKALKDKSFEAFVPTFRRRKRKGFKDVALLPSYVFVMGEIPWDQCNDDHADCIRDRHGDRILYGPLTFCGRLASIHDHEILHLQEIASEIDSKVDLIQPSLKPGDIGIMRAGPFEGRSGEIVSVSKGEAEIALRIFNSVRTVRAKIDKLEAA